MEESDRVSLDVNMLANSVREEFEVLHPLSAECCIYRVPRRLRELNEKAYTPQVVSVGPLHHGKAELKAMEEHKRRYLQEFLQHSEVSLEVLIKFIEKEETRLRNCYAETIEFSSEDFVRMVLLDAVSVIMVLLKNYFRDFGNRNDRIYFRPWLISYVNFDMSMLENQLPFFILGDLLNLSKIFKDRKECTMITLTHNFLKASWRTWVSLSEDNLEEMKHCKVEHFVDFLRICQMPSVDQKCQKELKTLSAPNSSKLHQAGVKFEKGSSQKIHDINFTKTGILQIPQLPIGDWSEILFRNLQAYEQCHCVDNYISDYIAFISLLVNSSKDVEILVQKGIIESWISGNDAILSLIHNLDKGNIFGSNFYFTGVVVDMNEYCSRRMHKWKATLKQNYLHNPWAIISVIAAAVLLILTFIQAACGIIQVS